MRDTLDFSFTIPDPATIAALGLGAAPYTGNARPSADWFAGATGLVDWITQETYSTRSQEGYTVGTLDARFAQDRSAERGYTGPIAVAVSDGNYADTWDASEYGRGWSDTATARFFPYGAKGITASFIAGALAGAGAYLLVAGHDGLPGDWVPETWGHGTIAGQVVGPSPIPGTDLNHVHVDLAAGGVGPTPHEEDDMGSSNITFLVNGYPPGDNDGPPPETSGFQWLWKDNELLPITEYQRRAFAKAPYGYASLNITPEDLAALKARLALAGTGGGGGGTIDPAALQAAIEAAVTAGLAGLRITRA